MNRIGYILILIWCTAAPKVWAQAVWEVEPLSLNHNYTNEIFAFPHDDGVIISSDRRTHIWVSRVDSANHPLFHLFHVSQRDSNKWATPRLLSKNIPINTHQGPFTISADGQEMYFTANDETGQRIYSAHKSGDEWINIQPFAHNRPNFTTSHPSLSPDGTRLFFASDIPGGFGGFDIYVCEWTPRGWGTPQNLGPEVNTSANELYPFIQGNGELFFSSSGHGSMGGLDIFSVREVGSEWGFLQRMEEPLNSTADDISYTATDGEGTSGYFASNRNGQTLDLYAFKSLFPVFTDCVEQEENDYTYEFREPGIRRLDTVPTIKIMWEISDGTVKYGDAIEHTFPSTGHYDIFINVLDTLTGEFSEHVDHYQLDVLDEEQPYITTGETVTAGVAAPFDASKTYLPDVNIEEYYWMFGDGTRKKGMYVEHTYAVPGMYRVQLGVIGKSKWTGEAEKVCVFREILVE
jgi:hypothetical protein